MRSRHLKSVLVVLAALGAVLVVVFASATMVVQMLSKGMASTVVGLLVCTFVAPLVMVGSTLARHRKDLLAPSNWAGARLPLTLEAQVVFAAAWVPCVHTVLVAVASLTLLQSDSFRLFLLTWTEVAVAAFGVFALPVVGFVLQERPLVLVDGPRALKAERDPRN